MKRRPLICVIGLRGIPGVMGGVESHCEELLPRIKAIAPEIDITVVGRKAYVGSVRRRVGGVEVVPLPSPTRQSTETLASTLLGVLYATVRRARAVHFHALGPALFAPLAKLLGRRVVFTIHGADYRRAKWGTVARLALRAGEVLGISAADAVICVSPSLTSEMRKAYPRHASKIHFIPNGAPRIEAGGDTGILNELGIAAGKFVLAVGRIEPGKGFELLIDAFATSGTDRKLVIAGAAHHGAAYADELFRRATGNIVFAGQQPRSKLAQLYRSAALFVLPSFHEGLPICALEAAALGCPVLLSDIQANKDLGLPAHHYFPCGDQRALSAILADLNLDLHVTKGALAQFDWDRAAAETAEIYKYVVRTARAPLRSVPSPEQPLDSWI